MSSVDSTETPALVPQVSYHDISPQFSTENQNQSGSCGPRPGELPLGEEVVFLRWDLPQMDVTIRTLQEKDVRLLEWHGGENLRSFYTWQWSQHCEGEREVLVAIFNGFPIGQVALHWGGKAGHVGVPDIQSLRVQDCFRGLQIGSRLIEACEMEVRRRGCGRIGLAVALENPKARRLYERLGYRADGPEYMDEWHYFDARGERIDIEERVIDLIKDLGD